MFVYSRKGIMEICRHSRQPKADAFMDFAWDVMDDLLSGKLNSQFFTPDQMVRVIEALAKSTPHGLPYAAAIAKRYMGDLDFMPVQEASTASKHVKYNTVRSVVDFLNFYGNVFGMATKEVFTHYENYCFSHNMDPLKHIEFSRQVCKSLGGRAKSIRLDGKVQRVFVNN